MKLYRVTIWRGESLFFFALDTEELLNQIAKHFNPHTFTLEETTLIRWNKNGIATHLYSVEEYEVQSGFVASAECMFWNKVRQTN